MTGKGFEFAAASELLLRGIVCHMATVDAGVDIMSWSRTGRRIKIQVKGRNFSGHGSGVETVHFSSNALDDPSTRPDFVIVVLRYTQGALTGPKYGSKSYLVLPGDKLEDLERQGYLSAADGGEKKKLQFNATFNESNGIASRVVLQKSYGRRQEGYDASRYLSAWNQIIEDKGF